MKDTGIDSVMLTRCLFNIMNTITQGKLKIMANETHVRQKITILRKDNCKIDIIYIIKKRLPAHSSISNALKVNTCENCAPNLTA